MHGMQNWLIPEGHQDSFFGVDRTAKLLPVKINKRNLWARLRMAWAFFRWET